MTVHIVCPKINSANLKSRTYPLQHRFGSLRATSRTTLCRPSPASATGPSKTPKIDVQKGSDVIDRLAEEAAIIFHALHGPFQFLRSQLQQNTQEEEHLAKPFESKQVTCQTLVKTQHPVVNRVTKIQTIRDIPTLLEPGHTGARSSPIFTNMSKLS